MNTIDIKIQLLSDSAKLPEKGTPFSAGYDIFSPEDYELKPMERHLFKTGLKTSIPPGIYGRIAPRSGLALKNGIDVMAGICDSDYRGEIGVILINLGQDNVKINKGDKIAQLIFEPYCNAILHQSDLLLDNTVRGTGGFGSTTDIKPSTFLLNDTTIKKSRGCGNTIDIKPSKFPKNIEITKEGKISEIFDYWKEKFKDINKPTGYEALIKEKNK